MSKFDCQQIEFARRGEQGMALVMALLILLVMSILIMGYSSDVETDIYISRNLQLKHQAFNWAETGLDVAQEIVGYSVDTRGGEPESIIVDNLYSASLTDGTLPLYTADVDNSGFIELCLGNTCPDGDVVADVTTIFRGSRPSEGGSIIIAAGYEGIGKGIAGAGGFSSYYQLLGRGYERHNSEQAISIMYRHVLR